MVKAGIWKVHPVKNEIILTLIRHKGEMLDSDLLRVLKNEYPDFTKSQLYKQLFALEVEMIIEVTRIRKNQYRVALRSDAPLDESLLRQLKQQIE